jgi:putrescine importer
MHTAPTLKRSLGMWAIVALGLGYMTPVVVFDTFGTVAAETSGAVPAAYLMALVVMLFTALSYGKMVRVFPGAGSAYTYTRETMHPTLGFMVGWAALLDYLLLPMVNAVIIRSYMISFFPAVPPWIWVVAYVVCITAINVYGMTTTSKVNSVLVVFQVVLIGVFLVLTGVQIAQGLGEGTLVTMDPLVHPGVHAAAVLSGATVVAFSFIGFDAVTMYTEEAIDPKTVPRAILLTVVLGGAIFFAGGWFAQVAFPTVDRFTDIANSTLPQIALFVGGSLFKIFFVAAAFAGAVASSLASHASVSRLLYVMGRNGTLVPSRLFGYVHPRYRTPVFTVVLVGVVSLLAVAGDLALVASVINFGALIAFTFVNLSVIAHYVIRQRRYKTARDFGTYVVLPLVGACLTGLLWYFLDTNALVAGLTWCGLGFAYLLILTRGFRKPVVSLDADAGAGELERVS